MRLRAPLPPYTAAAKAGSRGTRPALRPACPPPRGRRSGRRGRPTRRQVLPAWCRAKGSGTGCRRLSGSAPPVRRRVLLQQGRSSPLPVPRRGRGGLQADIALRGAQTLQPEGMVAQKVPGGAVGIVFQRVGGVAADDAAQDGVGVLRGKWVFAGDLCRQTVGGGQCRRGGWPCADPVCPAD